MKRGVVRYARDGEISSRYLWWLGLIALFCVSFSLWFLYDGMITYPKQRERGLAYEELKEKGATGRESGGHGPKSKDGRVPILASRSRRARFTLNSFCRRWLGCRDCCACSSSFASANGGRNGRRPGCDQLGPATRVWPITKLDKKKWKAKGIAKISYEQDGRTRRMVLDDWKFDDVATEQILREVESRIDVDQIVGGPPQPPLEDEPDDVDSSEAPDSPEDLDSDADQEKD